MKCQCRRSGRCPGEHNDERTALRVVAEYHAANVPALRPAPATPRHIDMPADVSFRRLGITPSFRGVGVGCPSARRFGRRSGLNAQKWKTPTSFLPRPSTRFTMCLCLSRTVVAQQCDPRRSRYSWNTAVASNREINSSASRLLTSIFAMARDTN